MAKDGPEPYRVPITRWVDADGKRCKSKARGARQVKTESKSYYADLIIDDTGKPQRVALGTANLRDAWVELRRVLRAHGRELRDASRTFAGHDIAPIDEQIDDWIDSLRAAEGSKDRLDTLRARVSNLFAAAGWRCLADVTADTCRMALHGLMADNGGISAQTRNHYLSAAKQLLRWAWTSGRIPSHPLLAVKPITTEGRRRHERRCPTEAEIISLFAFLATDPAPVRTGTRGPIPPEPAMGSAHRALAYRVMMATGFRLSELRSLERGGIDFEAGTITVRAGYSKRRRTDTQHVPGWILAELREWIDGGGALFESIPHGKAAAKLLQRDLAGAGIPYVTRGPDGPLYFDHHSFRHFYITMAAAIPGIDLKTLLEMTRHSTPDLTLRVYAKAQKNRLRDAADQIPQPPIG